MSAIPLFFLVLLLQITAFSFATAQQGPGIISPGAYLYADKKSHWLSNSGQFAFGFYNDGNNLAVGIWYAKIQQKTIVWTANRDAPLPLSNDVKLLLSDVGIRVMAPVNQTVLATISNIYERAASASMLDSGNFVLYNSNSEIIWQSFDTPTDTIVPGQQLLAGNKMVSSISDRNHASGRFKLLMQRDGNLVQYPDGPIVLQPYHAYWDTRTSEAGDNVSLNLDHNGQLYLLNSTNYKIWSNTNRNQLLDTGMYRMTIDFDGILRLHSHTLIQNDSWLVQWSSSYDKCAPLGRCGLNAYCVAIDQDPPCVCLPGFVFIDQRQRDLGCRRNESTVGCPDENGIKYSIADLDGLVWENTPYSVLNITETACRVDCLRDCYCEAAVYLDQMCQKQRFPLIFGRTDGSGSTLIKIVTESSGTKTVSKARKVLRTGIFIGGIAMLTFALIILAITGFVIYRYCVADDKKIPNSENGGFVQDVALRSYTYCELEKATKGFSDQVGRGAFGTVYKGVIPSNGGRVVAIKKLEKVADQGDWEFRNELNAIGRTHHKNLVKLLGYCHDGSNRLLVYEYMTNGSLVDFLFRSDGRPTWKERIGICLNVARGILYLHEECDTQIIHCDIKPENILMSDQKCAKLADFGLAKLLKPDQTRTYTGLRGTRGYVAPEWHRKVSITVKADVYSFGVLLLEIICCKRCVNMDIPEDQVTLENWVYHCLEADELDKLVKDEDVDKNELRRMVKVGLWCIQDELAFRPSMKKIVPMLEGTVEIPNPPSFTAVSSSIS